MRMFYAETFDNIIALDSIALVLNIQKIIKYSHYLCATENKE